MNKLIFALPIFALSALNSQAQTDSIHLSQEQQKAVCNIAEFWVTQLTKAENLDTLMAITATPFARERKKILTSKSELKDFFQYVFNKKGKRIVDYISSSVVKTKYAIEEICIPTYVALVQVKVKLTGEEEGKIIVAVQVSDTYKIVGFKD